MDAHAAHEIARRALRAKRDRFDDPLIEHAERVAAAVPADAHAVAFLHDVLEWGDTSIDELRTHDLTALEQDALELLTRPPDESYELHALRIACAPGPAGDLARTVKLADLDDHLVRDRSWLATPPYRWARRHIARAGERRYVTRVPA